MTKFLSIICLFLFIYSIATKQKKNCDFNKLTWLYLLITIPSLSFFVPVLYKFFSNLGTDSFIEMHNFDTNEALFYFTTLRDINSVYFRLESYVIYTFLSFLIYFIIISFKKKYNLKNVSIFIPIVFFITTNFSAFKLNSHLYEKLNKNKIEYSQKIVTQNSNRDKNALTTNNLKIIFYLGEATTGLNMSLYNYPRKTTPLLESLESSNRFFKYENIFSTYTHTTESLLDIFTVKNDISKEPKSVFDKKYYSLIDILNKSKIKSSLISNQPSAGSFNYFSPLLFRDRYHSNNDQLLGNKQMKIRQFDHAFFAKTLKNKIYDQRDFIILHSYAGHGSYLKYIPSKFHKLHIDDLFEKNSSHILADKKNIKQRDEHVSLLNDYDNTIRYIDFSINETIKFVDSKEDPIIFIYMPDHGEGVFNNSGHDSARQSFSHFYIPTIVYFNKAAYDSFPNIVEMINQDTKESRNSMSFSTQITTTILDIFNIKDDQISKLPRLGYSIQDFPYYFNVRNLGFNKQKFINFQNIRDDEDKKFNHFLKTRILYNTNKKNIFCLHGSNSFESILKGRKIANCLETDVVIEKDDIYIYHPPYKSNFTLAKYTNLIKSNKSENVHLWFDLKNFGGANCNDLQDKLTPLLELNTVQSLLLELPSDVDIDSQNLKDCMTKITHKFSNKVEFSYYISDDLIDKCMDSDECRDLKDKIKKIINSKSFANLSFDKKLNQWPDLKNFKNSIDFNSWAYYAHDIDSNVLSHKRIIYKNKEVNQE